MGNRSQTPIPTDRQGSLAMKGDARPIEGLNEIFTGELTGINQYFIHANDVSELGLRTAGGKDPRGIDR